jgi:hypothetical protein
MVLNNTQGYYEVIEKIMKLEDLSFFMIILTDRNDNFNDFNTSSNNLNLI